MKNNKVKVLFLASNPSQTEFLDINKEIKSISRNIRASEHRDAFELMTLGDVEPDDLLQALNEHKPTIVHFSGHGTQGGAIILEDENGNPTEVTAQALKALFATLKGSIQLVFLNACYSNSQASAISEVIDCVIGIHEQVTDSDAIAFAASFYRALGFGLSIGEAYEQGKVALGFGQNSEEITPILLMRDGIEADSIFLIEIDQNETVHLPGGNSISSNPGRMIIEIHTEFFNKITESLWQWRYTAMQVAIYGRNDDAEKFFTIAGSYDRDSWPLFCKIRLEISRAQRYISHKTYLNLLALYVFIVEVDKELMGLISLTRSTGLNAESSDSFSRFNNYIYAVVTNTIESAIASIAIELRLY